MANQTTEVYNSLKNKIIKGGIFSIGKPSGAGTL
jgi:hypothetical protein